MVNERVYIMERVLKIILGLIGVVIMFMGLNVGLAGVPTMGWLGSNEFILPVGDVAYEIISNHARFLGGVWFAVGLVFLVGGVWLEKMRTHMIMFCLMIGVAGFFRFSALDFELVFGGEIAPSLALEVIGFPLLAMWLWRGGRVGGDLDRN